MTRAKVNYETLHTMIECYSFLFQIYVDDGKITIEDFKKKAKINRWLKSPKSCTKELQKAFAYYDKNGRDIHENSICESK